MMQQLDLFQQSQQFQPGDRVRLHLGEFNELDGTIATIIRPANVRSGNAAWLAETEAGELIFKLAQIEKLSEEIY